MSGLCRWLPVTVAMCAAISGSVTAVAAQEGDGRMEGTPRHGYYYAPRPNVTLSLWCGFSGDSAPEALIYQESTSGGSWRRVGGCSISHSRDAEPIAIGKATRLFIAISSVEAAPGASVGASQVTREGENDCGIRLRFSDSAGDRIRVMLIDPTMAFGHGAPITPLCDPLLDHYGHF